MGQLSALVQRRWGGLGGVEIKRSGGLFSILSWIYPRPQFFLPEKRTVAASAPAVGLFYLST